MLIYLKHPQHGVKIAYMDLEAEQDEQNGWVRYNPSEPDVVSETAPEVVSNTMVKRRKRNGDENIGA